MIESAITISVTGLLAGFIFSMPIAGPISILIVSNALKGRLRYCILASLGSFIADFTYAFIAVFGLTKLYTLYKPAIPYIFAAGSLFFLYLGYSIMRTKIDIESLEDRTHLSEKMQKKGKGGLFTGFMVNLLNPTLFIGVLTSSFFVISLIASLGLNTGGLEGKLDQNLNEISSIEGKKIDNSKILSIESEKLQSINKEHEKEEPVYPASFHLIISICYAFFLSLGSILWLYLLSLLLVRFRLRINIKLLSLFIRSLGAVLCLIGLFFIYLTARMFISV